MNADPSPATMHNEHVSADQTDDDLCEEEPPDDPPEAKWRSNGNHVDIHANVSKRKTALLDKRRKPPSPTSSSVNGNGLNSSLDFLSNIRLDVHEIVPKQPTAVVNNGVVKPLPHTENKKSFVQTKPPKAVTIKDSDRNLENGKREILSNCSRCTQELSPNYKASVEFLNSISLDAVPENQKQTKFTDVVSPSLYAIRKSSAGTKTSNLKIQLPEVFKSPGVHPERCVIEITGGLPVCSNTPTAVERCASLPLQSTTPANLVREKSARESLDFLTNISLGAPATGLYEAYPPPSARVGEENSKFPAPSPRCDSWNVGSPQKYVGSRNHSVDIPPMSPKLLPRAKQLSFSEEDSTPPPKWSNKMEWGTFEGFMGSIGMVSTNNRRKAGLGADVHNRQFKNKQDWERRHIGGFLLVPRNQSERRIRMRKARRSFGSYQESHEGDSYEDPAIEAETGTRSARSSMDSEDCILQDRCIFPVDEQRQTDPLSLVPQDENQYEKKERGKEFVLSEGHCNLALFSNLSSAHLLDSRIMLYPQDMHAPAVVTGALRAPISVFSVIKFRQDDFCPQGDPGEIVHSVETQLRLKHGSYAELLERRSSSDSGSEDEKPKYNPYFLDDPEMRISKDRTVIKQEGYMVSCIPYVKPLAMKEELNGLFLAKHGDWLEGREITLSKIRALKSGIVTVVKLLDLELSTAAMAHVYLEKLILKNLVRKHSRKVTAAVCLLLAVKFNEVPRDTRVCAIQDVIERQNRFDCTLFIASTDPGVFLPADLLKYFEGLLPNHDDAKKQLLSKRPYIVVTLRDRASAIKAKEAISKVTLPSNQSIVADFVPSNYVSREGKVGRGKACSVTDLLSCMNRVLGVDKRAVLDEEFPTFVDLELSLHIGAEELLPHFHRILQSLDTTPAAYMGQDNPSMLEAESLAQFSVIKELEENGVEQGDLDRVRGVLMDHAQKLIPWLAEAQ